MEGGLQSFLSCGKHVKLASNRLDRGRFNQHHTVLENELLSASERPAPTGTLT